MKGKEMSIKEFKELEKSAKIINKSVENLKKLDKLGRRVSCKNCQYKQVWKADNGDFICIAKLKKPIRHTELGLYKDNMIRKCLNIRGVGRRVEEMDEAECLNIAILSTRLLNRIGVLNKSLKVKKCK